MKMNFDPSPYLLNNLHYNRLYGCLFDNKTKTILISIIVQRILVTTNRFYSDTVKYPKITTHYTIHPRESDPRWKGKARQQFCI